MELIKTIITIYLMGFIASFFVIKSAQIITPNKHLTMKEEWFGVILSWVIVIWFCISIMQGMYQGITEFKNNDKKQ